MSLHSSGWELLIDPRMSSKALRLMQAMAVAAPEADTQVTEGYMGRQRNLMVYGPGAPYRLPIINAHIARGGHVVMWDMGYWRRKQAMRLSIDALHPTPAQLDMAPAESDRREFHLREDADPAGPIMLVGLGPKSVSAYGLRADQHWERTKVRDLLTRFPGREIVWRPKGAVPVPLLDLRIVHGQPIEVAMRGCSLIVSHHSNCSIDACAAGIPFETVAGAALWFKGREYTPENRLEFLRLLSWWEWSWEEAPAAWDWIRRVLAR